MNCMKKYCLMINGRSSKSIVKNLKLYVNKFNVSRYVGEIKVEEGMEDYLFIELILNSEVIGVINKVSGIKGFVKFGGEYVDVYESVS